MIGGIRQAVTAEHFFFFIVIDLSFLVFPPPLVLIGLDEPESDKKIRKLKCAKQFPFTLQKTMWPAESASWLRKTLRPAIPVGGGVGEERWMDRGDGLKSESV